MPPTPTATVRDLVDGARRICVLTGAGMSAESGIATFRDAQVGLWAQYDPTELASPQAWAADPELVWGWYRWRTRLVARAHPNDGHRALARFAQRRLVEIVTQNVDDLHERAGSEVLSHLHGSLFANRCERCQAPEDRPDAPPDLDEPDGATASPQRVPPPRCHRCGAAVRPGVVWFGEALPVDALERAAEAVTSADLVLVVGTSGMVYPAAGLPGLAQNAGVPVVEINPQPTALSGLVDHVCRGSAATVLPEVLG
jgi:NAD-dependent deacetylase